MSERNNTRQALEALLARRNEHPEGLSEIDREIWEVFGERHALWVLDMSGFSRLTVRYGITHFLAMIHRLHGIVRPIVVRKLGLSKTHIVDTLIPEEHRVRSGAGYKLRRQAAFVAAQHLRAGATGRCDPRVPRLRRSRRAVAAAPL